MLLYEDFIPRMNVFFNRMMNQGGNYNLILQLIRKFDIQHPGIFVKYSKICLEVIEELSMNAGNTLEDNI